MRARGRRSWGKCGRCRARCPGITFPGGPGNLPAGADHGPMWEERAGIDSGSPTNPEVPTMFRTGLLILGLLSVADLLLPLLTDGESPPVAVALVAAALGLASLVLVISAWRGARKAILPLIV